MNITYSPVHIFRVMHEAKQGNYLFLDQLDSLCETHDYHHFPEIGGVINLAKFLFGRTEEEKNEAKQKMMVLIQERPETVAATVAKNILKNKKLKLG